MNFEMPLIEVKGVGEALASKLAILGVKTAGVLIDFYPRRYEDYSEVTKIANLKPGPVTIEAKIKQARGRYVRRGMHITEAVASDETSSVRLVWFNQPYRAGGIKSEATYYISGNFELSHQHLQIMNPSVELASDFPVNTARILPVYKLTKGLTTKQIRKIVKELVPLIRELPETLPVWLINEQKLISRTEAIENMHFPQSPEKLAAAKKRLGFEEVFSLSLASQLVKKELAEELVPAVKFDEKLAKEFVRNLPFTLTDAQRKVAWQILQDLGKTQPMNRLVEGDVGSGKTVIAAMAAGLAMKQNFQIALMAPTEILAKQHADTISKLLAPLGLGKKVGLLTGNMRPADKSAARNSIAGAQKQFIVGTHALITENVNFKRLALVIVDEQHRFGV
ncbi:MAG: DEAD/DEAH box helicase, partial [Candidatus Saccharimonadales bacterium]